MMSDDAELAAIRAKRMQQLQGQSQQGQASQQQQQQQQKQQQEEAEAQRRHLMLSQLLDSSARERLNRINMVKPQRARQVEDWLLMQSGRFGGKKVSESILVDVLEQFRDLEEQHKPKVVVQRRRAMDSDDDSDDYGL
jgi:programmed cell death protein 5